MKNNFYRLIVMVCLVFGINTNLIARDFTPLDDDVIVEKLAPRVGAKMAAQTAAKAADLSEDQAHAAALQWIQLSRQTSDPRYLGRAQSVLSKWWDKEAAPNNIAVLQATIEQSRHEFDKARIILSRVVRNDTTQAQAWLTLATLARLNANYPSAIDACIQTGRAGAALYAQACLLETQSLQGDFANTRLGFNQLLQTIKSSTTSRSLAADQSWIWSLQAENEERAGQDDAALRAYSTSLALSKDVYTAIAYADALLRTAKPAKALQVLLDQPDSDAILLRRAYALKQMGDPNWRVLNQQLKERFAALKLRGEESRLHARELALTALWLDQDYQGAAALAMINLQLQKEPFDWWLALSSSQNAGLFDQVSKLSDGLMRSGLVDQRLSALQAKKRL